MNRDEIHRGKCVKDYQAGPSVIEITTPLYKHAYYLSDEYKDKHDQIPWVKISGLRHRLVHDYEDTNWEIVNNIVFHILPGFLEDVKKL